MPKSARNHLTEYEVEDEFGAKDFSKDLELKNDHKNRPIWIVNKNK